MLKGDTDSLLEVTATLTNYLFHSA